MNENYIILISGIAKTGMEEYVKRVLTQMMEHSRQDKGCFLYNIHQSLDEPAEFMVYMIWENKAAFEHHNEKPEMVEFRKRLADELFAEQSPKSYWRLLS
jgi:quinol monooxygenase YgiN